MSNITVGPFSVSVVVDYPNLKVSADVDLPSAIPDLGGKHSLGSASVNIEKPSANLSFNHGINLGVFSGHVNVVLNIVADFNNTQIQFTGTAKASMSGYVPKTSRKCILKHCVDVPDGVKHENKDLLNVSKSFQLSYGTPLKLAGLGSSNSTIDAKEWVKAINSGKNISLPQSIKVTPNLADEVQAMLTFVGAGGILHEIKKILSQGIETVKSVVESASDDTLEAMDSSTESKFGLIMAYGLGGQLGAVIGAGVQGGFYVGIDIDKTDVEIGLFGTGFYDLGLLLGGDVAETYSIYWQCNGVSALDNFKGAGTFIQASLGVPVFAGISVTGALGLYWNNHVDGHFPPKDNPVPCGISASDGLALGPLPISASLGQSQTVILGTKS